MVVLAVGILGVFASFSFSIESTRHGAHLSEAVSYNRQIIELIRVRNLPFMEDLPPPESSGLNDPETETWTRLPALNALPFANDLPENTGFRRSIQVRRVSNDVSDYRYQIAEITVTVYWMENGRLRKVRMTAHHRQP